MTNVIPVWKPPEISSTDLINQVKSVSDVSKIGHSGTLDPFAEGVMILLFNHETKNFNKYLSLDKTYHAKIKLGEHRDTLDLTGDVIYKKKPQILKHEIIEKNLINFIGETYQRPPAFSAKRINSVRLYALARKGVFVHLKPVKINIQDIGLIDYSDDAITINVTCGSGTYIRSLAKDICSNLGEYGYLESLVRTEIGDIDKNKCYKIEEIKDWKSLIQ